MTIDAPCLDCGKPVSVRMKNGQVLEAEPEKLRGYVSVPFSKWLERLPYA